MKTIRDLTDLPKAIVRAHVELAEDGQVFIFLIVVEAGEGQFPSILSRCLR